MEKEYKTDQERMAVAIYLAATNVAKGTGGPFGTAIFERNVKTGITKLFAVGVNRVVPLSNSTLHGETTAIQMAQNKLKTYSLKKAGSANKNNLVEYDLYTSCEPCCMCLGATLWSGVSRMVCAATKEDAKAIGFDEVRRFLANTLNCAKFKMLVSLHVFSNISKLLSFSCCRRALCTILHTIIW